MNFIFIFFMSNNNMGKNFMQMEDNGNTADITPYWEDNGNADIPPNRKDNGNTADIT